MDLGTTGVWSAELRYGDESAATDAAAEVEALGYTALWFPGGGKGAFDRAAALLRATQRMAVATGIVSVWACDGPTAAARHAELTAAHPGRFVLGLGVSHATLVDRAAPGRYQQPVATMGSFLDELDAAAPPVPVAERLIAALGPRMMTLAGQRSAGTHPYLVSPEHTALARELLGPGLIVAPEQAVVFETDATLARAAARAHLATYLGLPNYVNNWRRLGYTDADFADGGSDQLVDGLVAWGAPDAVADRIRAHHDAGADHVCIQAIGDRAGPPPVAAWRLMAEVLHLGS